MKYSVEKYEDYQVLQLQDHNLNAALAPHLKSQLVIFRNEGIQSVIIDLQEVKYIDSSGLSALLTGKRLWEGVGSFVVSGPFSPTVKKIFTISKLDTVLNIVPTLQEAKDFVAMENLEREINADDDLED